MLLAKVDHSGWLIHAPIDVPNVEVLGRVHHEELAQSVHEALGTPHRLRVIRSIVVDSTPFYAHYWQFAGIAPDGDRGGVGVVVDPIHAGNIKKCKSHSDETTIEKRRDTRV